MKRCFALFPFVVHIGLMLTSCNNQLDYGINWNPSAAEEQFTKDSLKIEIEWIGDSAYLTATVNDKEGRLLAYISKQKDEDFCTVIKYLRNDTGGVRGVLVYPGCYPIADRRGEAKIKESNQSYELLEYKNMLWKDFYKGNHPCNIGLALVLDEREDRPYAARYYFKYDGSMLTEVYDPMTNKKIQSESESMDFEIHRQTMYLENDTVIGDIQLIFKDEVWYEPGCFTYMTYAGYRPMEEMEFMGGMMSKHIIFRSDVSEPFVTMSRENCWTHQRYVLNCDYDDKTMVSTYVDGILQKVEEISQWGTVLQQDVFFESTDKKAYICYLKSYNYQTKQLVKKSEERISKTDFSIMFSENKEMHLDGYLHLMWGRFGIDSYWDALRSSLNEEAE